MKIKLVNWYINDVGGINSWAENFMLGARHLGHECDHIYVTTQYRFQVDPAEKIHKRRYSLLPGRHLSLRDEFQAETLEDLADCDVLLFIHPSPHPTKENIGAKWAGQEWLKAYQVEGPRKIVVFHDEKWEKTNDWFEDARGFVHLAVAAQHRFLPSMERWADGSCETIWEYFPMPTLEPPPIYEGVRERGIVFTQWLKWKNHAKFLPLLPEITVPIDFYGGGMEYHNLCKDGFNMADTTQGETGDHHRYHGFVPYDEVMERLRQSMFAIDLSQRGYTNMSHWEPLWFGTPGLIHEDVLNDEYCEIPSDLAIDFHWGNVVPLINSLPRFNSSSLVRDAQKFVAYKCAPQRVAEGSCQHVDHSPLRSSSFRHSCHH